MAGARTQAERAALTVEIGFALPAAVVRAAVWAAAAVGVGALAGWNGAGAWQSLTLAGAGAAFAVRVVRVLRRWSPPRAGGTGRSGPDS